MVTGHGYLVYDALDDGDATGPHSVQGEEHIVSLDWDDSSRVSRQVLVLSINNTDGDCHRGGDILPILGYFFNS